MSRLSKDEWGIKIAQLVAQRGTCCRRQVGCVLVDARGQVMSTGYNGVAAGETHCEGDTRCQGADLPSGTGLDKCQAIHAEQNALLQCSAVWDIRTCYVTHSPCTLCVRLLLNTGCTNIVFLEEYPGADEARRRWNRSRPDRVWARLLLD